MFGPAAFGSDRGVFARMRWKRLKKILQLFDRICYNGLTQASVKGTPRIPLRQGKQDNIFYHLSRHSPKETPMPLPINVNLADKFSPKLDQAFKLMSYTDPYVNQDYDFDGVNSIKVYTLDSTPLVNYDVSNNTNRYGGFSEITDTVATYTLANDKAFQKSLDTLNMDDSAKAKSAAKWLAIQMNQVIVPTIDRNRLATAATAALAAGGGGTEIYAPATVLNQFRKMNANLDNISCPLDGRVFYITPFVLNAIKEQLTPLLHDTSDAIVHSRGLKGLLDGVPVVCVPENLFPAKTKALMWHKSALLSARKLTETKILDGAWVVSGNIIQGRFRYDSWPLKGHNSDTGVDTKLATFQSLTVA